MTTSDVAIVGAGPYGLSAAAHLNTVKGLDVRVFGQPMSFWDRNMPAGMFLRSNWTATQIADPDKRLTLEKFQEATGTHVSKPVPLEQFVQYGRWYQSQAVPHLDQRGVQRIESNGNGFRLTLQDGEVEHARRVVVAVGINSFAWRPMEFRNLPSESVSHASEHRDLGAFAGKRVLVIGSGQSALESAALLHEAGVEVIVMGKARKIQWLGGRLSTTLHSRMGGFTRHMLYAPTDVGPAGLSQLVARPHLFKVVPRPLRDKLSRRCIRPAGARWLYDRLKDVPITLGRTAVAVSMAGDQVKVTFDDASVQMADHVLLGTGYRVDISKYDFLAPELVERIDRFNGYPRLKRGLETSLPGLHILGAPAAWSVGPLMRFVSGAGYASRSLLASISAR